MDVFSDLKTTQLCCQESQADGKEGSNRGSRQENVLELTKSLISLLLQNHSFKFTRSIYKVLSWPFLWLSTRIWDEPLMSYITAGPGLQFSLPILPQHHLQYTHCKHFQQLGSRFLHFLNFSHSHFSSMLVVARQGHGFDFSKILHFKITPLLNSPNPIFRKCANVCYPDFLPHSLSQNL